MNDSFKSDLENVDPGIAQLENELCEQRASSLAGILETSDNSPYITGQVFTTIRCLRMEISSPAAPAYVQLLTDLKKIEPNWTDQIGKNLGSLLVALAWDPESGLDSVQLLKYADIAAEALPSLRPQLSELIASNTEKNDLGTLLIGLLVHDRETYQREVVERVMVALQN